MNSKTKTYCENTGLSSFCNIKPEDTYLREWIEEFLLETKKLGLRIKPRFRFHDEWYYADGSVYICIPFYLADKKISETTKKLNLNTEGHSKSEFLKLLRHEYGHMIESAYSTRKMNLRRKTFGSNSKYPKSYVPKENKSQYVNHLANHYAQSHPDEDFAETFAVFMTGTSKWKKKYKNTGAYQKLICMGTILSICKSKSPRKLAKFNYSPLRNDKRTLLEFTNKLGQKPKNRNTNKDPEKKLFQKWFAESSRRNEISALESEYLFYKLIEKNKRTTLRTSSNELILLEKQILKNKEHHISM